MTSILYTHNSLRTLYSHFTTTPFTLVNSYTKTHPTIHLLSLTLLPPYSLPTPSLLHPYSLPTPSPTPALLPSVYTFYTPSIRPSTVLIHPYTPPHPYTRHLLVGSVTVCRTKSSQKERSMSLISLSTTFPNITTNPRRFTSQATRVTFCVTHATCVAR